MLSHESEVKIQGYRAQRLLWRNQGEAVYAATRSSDGLPVTAKVYERALYEQAPGRFEYEYRALTDLGSAALTPAVTMLELGERRAWVFPRPSGEPLLAGLAQPLELERWLDVASQAAAALAALHARRLTHRHLRPRALTLEPEAGRVVLTDLGFSLAQDRAARDLEQPDMLEASLPYLSPEQTGRIARSVDYRSDLYSLGTVLFQLATGRPPFVGQDVTALIHAHLAHRPPALSEQRRDLPRVVSDLVGRLLAKDPSERYQSAEGLLSDLRRCRVGFAGGRVFEFELRSDDRPAALELPERLYGRDDEAAALRRALAEARTGRCSVWVISGAPGIGKSALVDAAGVELAGADGHYATGKFELARRAPFAAFVDAIDGLSDVLLARPEHERVLWRVRIGAALGGLGSALLELTPALQGLLGEQLPLPDVGSLEAKHRTELAIVRFFRAVASAEEPLLLFIDDLHWSDPGSIDVWERLALDEQCRGLVLVGAYRTRELPEEHPFHAGVERIEARGVSVGRIALGAISAEAAARLMMDGLRLSSERARTLCELLSRRTEHNPLVIRKLLQLMAERGVLVRAGPRWTWQDQRLLDVGLPASLLDVIQTKIDALAERERAALLAASCLGSRVDSESLAAALECEPVTAFGLLAALREHGLLLEADGQYHFEHDGVLEAASARLQAEERYTYHVRAGRFRRGRAADEALDNEVFTIVGHLNRSIEREPDLERLLDLAQLNLRASAKAVRAAAYSAALDYVDAGLAALARRAPSGTQADVLSSSGLRLERARAIAFAGDYPGAGLAFDALLAEPLPELRLAEICTARVEVCLAAGRFDDALRWGLVGLAHTGLVLPRQPSKAALGRELLRAAWLTRGDIGRRIRELPECDAPHIQVRIELLSTLVIAVIRVGGEIVPLLFLAGARDTFRHGVTPAAPHALTSFGTLLVGVFGNLKAAAKVADEALALARAPNARHRAKVLLASQSMLLPWTRPFEGCVEELSKVYGVALLEGDAVLAGYGLVFVANCHLAMGVPLEQLHRSAERARRYLARTAPPDVVASQEVQLGIVDALAGSAQRSLDTDDPFGLLANADTSVRCAAIVFTSELHCITGQPERALRLLDTIAGVAELTLLAVSERAEYFFWRALAAAMSSEPGAWKGSPRRRAFAQGLRQYRRWAKLCPENFASKALLLEAESLRLSSSAEQAAPLYARAGELGQRHGRLHVAALAYERLARTSPRSSAASERGARQASQAYRAWGATRKAALLEAEFQIPATDNPAPLASIPAQTAPSAHGAVDVTSVLKTTRAITSAPDYPSVVERLMAGLIENAGAQRGVLVLAGSEGWRLEAAYGTGGVEPNGAGLPLELAQELVPVGMLCLVEKKRTPIIYDDAQREPSLARDPYVVARRVRAVMCIPIELSSRCIGVIYLENNLSPGIFTPARVEMAVALGAQAAISLSNARLLAALRASEAEWRSLVDHAPDWITIVNRQHIIEFSNHAPEGSAGRGFLGARVESFMSAAGRMSLSDAIEQVFERGGHVSLDTRLASEERKRSLVTRISPIAIDGKVPRVTLLSTDITERRALEEHLSQTQKLEAIGTLASGVAHDFNNLLSVIVSSCEVGLRDCPDKALHAPHRRVYDTILATTTRANSLTRQLLTFGRNGSTELEQLSLNEVVEHCCKMLERLVGEDVRIERRLSPQMGSVEINRGHLEQVLLNLSVNARDAMPGGGTLTLRTLELELEPGRAFANLAPGRYAQLSVSDTGCGMDEPTQKRVFEPFFTTKEIGRGTGLGLATVHGLVHRAGGHVRVASALGAGSTFDVFLPAVEKRGGLVAEPPTGALGLPRGTETILLVEDNQDVRALTAAMLEGQGYRVIAEASGDVALRNHAAIDAAHLLFTDVLLPGLKGPGLAREVLRRRPDIKVLYSSGGGLDFAREPTAPGLPLPPLLAKPYTLLQLARAVRSLLDADCSTVT